MNGRIWPAMVAVLFVSLTAGAEPAKQKIQRHVSREHLESILKDLNIAFSKVPGKSDGIAFYDFEKDKISFRLHNYNGKDLWIDAVFPASSLEKINQWNRKTLSGRAVLFQDDTKSSTYLECQLDCQGGVTDGMIRRFIQRFQDDAATFAKFLGNTNRK